jgi:hypothetical protein
MGNTPDAGSQQARSQQAPSRPDTWVHDAVDAASGRISSRTIHRSPAVASRVKLLKAVGFHIEAALLSRPRYRLSAQKPYLPSPQTWLDAFDGTYNAGPGVTQIWWRVPSIFRTEFWPTSNLSFVGLPPGPAVLSLRFQAWPQPGATGTVVIDIGAHRTQIPVSAPTDRTLDIGFVHDGAHVLTTMVLLRQGIYDFVFNHAILTGTALAQP